MVFLLMQADLVVLELNMRGRFSWIEPVLVDTAVPGFGNQPIRIGASTSEVRSNER